MKIEEYKKIVDLNEKKLKRSLNYIKKYFNIKIYHGIF